MTPATPKPRAGEHVPDKITMSIDWCAMFDKEHELTARLANDLEEAEANNDANALDATNARAERDLLRERERELIEVLKLMLKAWEQLMPNLKHGVVQDYELVCTTAPVKARAALAKVRP